MNRYLTPMLIPHAHPPSVHNSAMSFDITPPFNHFGHQMLPLQNGPHTSGTSNYHGAQPPPITVSRRSNTRSILLVGKCCYCRVIAHASPENPVWLCSGCGPMTSVRYCSRECLLADAFEHSTVCVAFYLS